MAGLPEEELIRNGTFIECVVIPPDKLRQMTNNEDLQFGGSREHKFEDFGKDENEKVEEKIQMLAGGSAEVASAFKKKRFLQKSLQDLFQNKTPLPDGMTIHFANTELARLNKKYSSQFKDLLGVKNTSDVIRRGLAEDMARAALLLGKQPKRERERSGRIFLY